MVGMGKAAFDASTAARAVFEEADDALGFSLSKLCFEGPVEDLKLTANTQPAVVTTSTAILRAFDLKPAAAAGHSLGEYSAHVAAGTLSFADAVKLVRARGGYMQDAVPVGEGAMAAIMKASPEAVAKACEDADGVVSPANFNSPGQIVIAGAKDPVAKVCETLKADGARAIPLPVSAPFHCALMLPAEEKLGADLEGVSFTDPAFSVYCNVDAAAVSSADAAKDALRRQVSRPVRWQESIEKMVEDGFDTFVEIGAGKVLTGLMRRINKEVKAISVQTPDDFDAAREVLGL